MMNTENKTITFKVDGKVWRTDAETLKLLREYRDAGDTFMLSITFSHGRECGRIVEA